jgi:hypothetical protein
MSIAKKTIQSRGPFPDACMVGHRLMAVSLLYTGEIAQGRAHLDRAIALYNPADHRPLATRFSADVGVALVSYRSRALWLLAIPRPRSETLMTHSRMRERWVKPPR